MTYPSRQDIILLAVYALHPENHDIIDQSPYARCHLQGTQIPEPQGEGNGLGLICLLTISDFLHGDIKQTINNDMALSVKPKKVYSPTPFVVLAQSSNVCAPVPFTPAL
ncbi:hypothetical protein FRC12_017561 [Ceratobasidium sp. 428]|nr:hypothetical protein FRC12_017561 [Ceratobasidium sp. 428]